MANPTPDSLVILLHGVGSNGQDLAPLAGIWRDALPNAAFAAPDAPDPFDQGSFDQGPGYQWFSIAGVTEATRPQRVAAARAAFDRTLQAVLDQHGFADRLDRVAFVGFSQGSIMALDAVASGRWTPGAVVAFSGRLSSPPPLAPARPLPLLLIHGAADPVIPAAETVQAAATLAGLGYQVESHVLRGVVHTISNQGAAMAGRHLAAALGGPPVA